MSAKRVLVYGGSGALGSTLVNHLKSKNYWIISVDMRTNDSANENILVDPNDAFKDQHKKITEKIRPILSENTKLDAIFNVAGGWAGGNAASDQFLDNCELMWKQTVWSSVISASLAAEYLNTTGMLTLPGAAVHNTPTPSMIGYGMAKEAVHHLTKSLGAKDGGLPVQACVAALMPVTLDTPMNRKWMPKADFSTWTQMSFIAELMEKWISQHDERPANGSLVKLVTADNKTNLTFE